jgi:hypothetical protein
MDSMIFDPFDQVVLGANIDRRSTVLRESSRASDNRSAE